MNFDFSDDQKQLRSEARRFFQNTFPSNVARSGLDGGSPTDLGRWKALAEMGFLGAAVPEAYGGAGAGYLELCVIAEEAGRSLAPAPLASSIFLVADVIVHAGDEAQKQHWLPQLVDGSRIGCLALWEGTGNPDQRNISCLVTDGRLSGKKKPVLDGDVAHLALVAAREAEGVSLFLVDLEQPGVYRAPVATIDPTRGQASIGFDSTPVERLGPAGQGWPILLAAFDRAAVLTAFEQLGGADRALEVARDHALDRMAFGRQIGSFQAIKHMLANMYVSVTLARSNAYYGAWALSNGALELPQAAAAARVSATEAFLHCARDNIQVHGGVGFTWEMDAHHYYRRANLLALTLGGPSYWEDLLVARLWPRTQEA